MPDVEDNTKTDEETLPDTSLHAQDKLTGPGDEAVDGDPHPEREVKQGDVSDDPHADDGTAP